MINFYDQYTSNNSSDLDMIISDILGGNQNIILEPYLAHLNNSQLSLQNRRYYIDDLRSLILSDLATVNPAQEAIKSDKYNASTQYIPRPKRPEWIIRKDICTR